MSDEPIGPGISGKTTCRVCGYRYYPSVEVHGHHAAPAAAPAPRDAAFQRLWTKYAALPEYDKAEWTAAFNEIWSGGPPTPAMIAAALDGLKIAHQVVEDCWYSCPKARDADGDSECCNDAISDGACNCGADAHNAKVEALRAALTAQSLPTEQQPAREAQPEPD